MSDITLIYVTVSIFTALYLALKLQYERWLHAQREIEMYRELNSIKENMNDCSRTN